MEQPDRRSPSPGSRFVVVDPERAASFATTHRRTFTTSAPSNGELTRAVPNRQDFELEVLDPHGIISVRTAVRPGTILVGRVETFDKPESAEEELVGALFGDLAESIRDVSLCAPFDCSGTVVSATTENDETQVVVEWERPLEVGDVLQTESGDRLVVRAIEPCDGDILRDGQPVGGSVQRSVTARDMLEARSIGAYDSVHEVPTPGHDAPMGRQFTLAQATALIEDAPWMVWETFSVRCDAPDLRARAYNALINQGPPLRDENGLAEIAGQRVQEKPYEPSLTMEHFAALTTALGYELAPMDGVAVRLINDERMRELTFGELVVETPDRALEALDSPQLFGPEKDFECACGKYSGRGNRGRICEECGVEILPSTVRRERSAWFYLREPCRHPLGDHLVQTIAVLPPALRSEQLQDAYAAVCVANQAGDDLQPALDALYSLLADRLDAVWKTLADRPVDFSGRAMLVEDPSLPRGTCRLPETLARELFKPSTHNLLEYHGHAPTIRRNKELVARGAPIAREAARIAAEQYPVLLAAGDKMVVRRATTWPAPAIAVAPETARLLDSETVDVHLPLSDQACTQCLALPDLPAGTGDDADWLTRRLGTSVARALAGRVGIEDPTAEPSSLLLALLGVAYEPVDTAALSKWRAEITARFDRPLRAPDKKTEPEADSRPLQERHIEELPLQVKTFNVLCNNGISTIGALCRTREQDLLMLDHFGRDELREVRRLLADIGLSLGMD